MHFMEALSRQNSSLIGRKNQAEIWKLLYFKKWACIDAKLLTTPKFNDLGISFSSAEDALSNDIKKISYCITLA